MNTMTEWEKIAKIWQIQLNLEYTNPNKNVRLSFKDIGSFAELMAINYLKGFIGGGSGGMGFDLINYQTHKAVEVKSCCTIQNAKCKKCGTKFNPFFVLECPKCKSKEYEEISDSRFGIDAKEFLEQYKAGLFDRFYLCFVSLLKYDKKTTQIQISIEWFEINFSNEKYRDIQLKYFENQVKKGKKAHCNLIPYSFDFYKLVPNKISNINVSFKVKNLEEQPIVVEHKCNDGELYIGIEKMHNKREREQFIKLKTYNKKTKKAKATDFTLNIDYAKKSLGKERGDTRAKIYSALK